MSTTYNFNLHADRETLEEIKAMLTVLHTQGEQLMTIAASTQAKLDALSTNFQATAAQLTTATAGISADIQALKDLLNAASNGMSEADVNEALAPLEAHSTALAAAAQALADIDIANP